MLAKNPKNHYVKNYIKEKKLKVEVVDEDRDWGGYYIVESGPSYDVKILWIKPKQLLSLQSHGDTKEPGHHEIWLALTDMRIVLGENLNSLMVFDRGPGAITKIQGGYIHSIANPFNETHLYVIETRISLSLEDHNQREGKIRRLYDKYERGNTPAYPVEMLNRILHCPFDPKFEGDPIKYKEQQHMN